MIKKKIIISLIFETVAIGCSHSPTVGVDDRLWHRITTDTVDWIAHILFGSDDNTKGKQQDDGDRVVQLEDIVVNLNAAGLEQRLQATEHVEHY